MIPFFRFFDLCQMLFEVFLIEKGGKIKSIAAGCDPSGLLANKVSEKVAELLKTDKVDVQQKVAEKN